MGTFEIQSDSDNAKLTVKLKNVNPVDLVEYSQSMISLGTEYSDYIAKAEGYLEPEDIKLFVKNIRTGSIIIELMALAPALIPFIEHSNTVIDFAKNLKGNIEYLKGNSSTEAVLDKQSLHRIIKFVEPVAKDNGSVMQIDAANNTGTININFNSNEAQTIKDRATELLEKMKEPIVGLHKQVVLYWVQARIDKKKGDKAIIESISDKEVKVVFKDEELKHSILHSQPHPFDFAYIVDVHVETIREKPILYKVIKYYEAIDLPE